MKDSFGEDVSIVQEWSASMKANAAKDPYWKAKVAAELKRNAHLADVINHKCSQCHAPMANYESDGEAEILGDKGVLDSSHPLHDAAMNGVSCTYCHQIENTASLGTLEGFSGEVEISDQKVAYGQYSDPLQQQMINQVGFTPLYGEHMSGSELCASCHNLKTPFVDANGNLASTTPESEFPEQMPYTEWENSIFSDTGSNPKSCQDCHMPATSSKMSTRPSTLPVREGFAKHRFSGANTVMLTLLRDNAAALDVDITSIDANITRSREMLQNAVTLEILSAGIDDDEAEIRLRLTNNSGHKAPTGYPSRRMWLHVRVTDSNGEIVFESGKVNKDGSINGADNDSDLSRIEPHHDLITREDQVQIYESVMGDTDGNVTFTLLRASHYLKDNRLTPPGFDKNHVPLDVAVQGMALDDGDFNEGIDEITYRFENSGSGDLTVEVMLNYQSITHGALVDLYKDEETPEVRSFRNMYDAQSLKFETMAVAETQINMGDDDEDAPVQVEEDAPEVVEDDKTTYTSGGGGGGSIGWAWLLLSALLAACGRRRIIRVPV
ncbi:MAG: multiheme c-type cytochrome [Sedimenticolaceae bacterium]|nr:multiheme c-type cytochrome [Sedimenticolaceae bacterium]